MERKLEEIFCMKKNNFFTSLPFKLLMGVFLGICIGLALNYADGKRIYLARIFSGAAVG